MADIKSIDMGEHEIIVSLKVTSSEYELLKNFRYDMLILPSNTTILENHLTTGKLGNSNRIMIPKKMLEREKTVMEKKVPSKIFKINGNTFLLIRLRGSDKGIPVFEEAKK